MKNAIGFLFSIVLFMCGSAQADDNKSIHATLMSQNVQFIYEGYRSFYSCDYVEHAVKQTLTTLGARNIKVSCNGGYPYDRANFVRASFQSIRAAALDKSTMMAAMTPVIVSASDSCDLYDQVIHNLLPSFEVYSQSNHSSCWDSRGTVEYDVTVLK